jgi:hypothetical protein
MSAAISVSVLSRSIRAALRSLLATKARRSKSAFTRVFDALWRSGMMRCRPGIFTSSEQRVRRACDDPGAAVHHQSARKTRVNALMVLHRIREMPTRSRFNRRRRYGRV